MSNQHEPENQTAAQEEALLREAFANVGKRQVPPQAKLDRWEAVFRAELGHKIVARKQRRLYVGAGAAMVLMLVGIAQFMTPQSAGAPVVATVVADQNGNKLFSDRQVQAVHPGLEVRVGDALLTGPNGHLTLDYHGADIRLKGDTSVRFHAAKLELMEGTVYVDTHAQSTIQPGTVVVSTDYGSFTHVGTQFLVQASSDGVVAAVREGEIIASNNANPENVPLSAAHGARQMRISAAGAGPIEEIDSHDGLWSWVTAAAPKFETPDATAHDLLLWATRELGVQLRYGAGAQEYAQEHKVHGALEVEHTVDMLKKIAPSIRIEQTASQWLVAIDP